MCVGQPSFLKEKHHNITTNKIQNPHAASRTHSHLLLYLPYTVLISSYLTTRVRDNGRLKQG